MLPESIKNYIKLHIENKNNNKSNNIPVSGKIFDEKELEYMIESIFDCHWTEGKWNELFEKKLAYFLGVKNVITTNSGSSANLLAFTTLTAKELGDKQIKPGDEVITVAAGFPTTINPIIQCGCTPVFVDVDLETYEVNIDELKKALSEKTKAIMLAHTLGNTFNLKEITKICKENNLWLIEDTCDALGAKYDGQFAGTFGDIATLSFYPAHHITMGEGGALITNNSLLAKIIRSYRDWGRDCWCKTGQDNSCNNRYNWKLGNLPQGFDHKYTYSRIGYNLKVTDMQAALGVAQLEKLGGFISKRNENFDYLKSKFIENGFEKYFILPKETENSEPSWFGFVLSIKEGLIFSREDLLKYLNEYKIGTRLLFAGNFLKQPAFIDYVKEYKVIGDLKNTNYIMNNTFWLGVFPGLDKDKLDYIILKINDYINSKY
ncbi:MAG: lipopolysaccharide biosynthesis protein RfbH [Candidatus Gracilibacteria bacterium]|nr:lipopolysaccharide biosynthesis protein RfbH [Candidatus Gracilibacteria bacterium]